MQSDGRLRQLNQYMSDILGCKEERLYQELHELFQSILPRKSLSDYGVTSSQLEEFTTSVLQNQRRLLVNNYVELNKEDIYEIYCYLYQ